MIGQIVQRLVPGRSAGSVETAQTIDNDSGLRWKRDLLLSISGVGENLAGVVLAELPGPDVLRSSAEVVLSQLNNGPVATKLD